MRLLAFRSPYASPLVNLAIEDYLFRLKDYYSECLLLFLYRNRACVVLGRNQNPFTECNLRALDRDRIPLIRRQSGGGTVYHDMGNTNYSIMMPRNAFDMRKSAELVANALRKHLDIPAEVTNRNDISVEGRKVSGSAYRLIQQRAFHHGTMLIDCDLTALHRYLFSAQNTLIETKGVASVRAEVANLRDWSLTITHSDFCEAVALEFGAQLSEIDLDASSVMRNAVKAQVAQMQRWAHVYGLTPTFTLSAQTDFSRWGRTICRLTSNRGLIEILEMIRAGGKMKDNLLHQRPFSVESVEQAAAECSDPFERDAYEWLSTVIPPTPLRIESFEELLDDK